MNIIFLDLTGINYPGGCEKYFASVANYFSKKNNVLILQSRQYFRFIEYLYSFLSGYKVGSIKFLNRDVGSSTMYDVKFSVLIPFLKRNQKLRKILDQTDIIYTKNEFQELALLYFLLGKENFSEKVVIGTHTAIFLPKSVKGIWRKIHDIQYNSRFYKNFLEKSKLIHVPNSDYVPQLIHTYRIPKEKIAYIPYFIDKNLKTLPNFTIKEDSFNILWAGRLTQQKGLDRLSNIIQRLSTSDNFNKIRIYIAGEGEKDVVQKLVSTYDNVKYIGFVKKMDELLVTMDLCIVTSFFETFGYNVLEPQSLGVPVISYNISGPNDIIIEGETGYLVQNEKQFCEKIVSLQDKKRNSPKDYANMKKRTYSIINEKFSKENVLKKIEKLVLS